jgi:hypothetical protein
MTPRGTQTDKIVKNMTYMDDIYIYTYIYTYIYIYIVKGTFKHKNTEKQCHVNTGSRRKCIVVAKNFQFSCGNQNIRVNFIFASSTLSTSEV